MMAPPYLNLFLAFLFLNSVYAKETLPTSQAHLSVVKDYSNHSDVQITEIQPTNPPLQLSESEDITPRINLPSSDTETNKSLTDHHDRLLSDEPFSDNGDFIDVPTQEEYGFDFDIYVRKCCPLGEAFFLADGQCGPSQIEFTAIIFNTATGVDFNLTANKMNIIEGLLTSCEPSILNPGEFLLLDNGELFLTDLSKTIIHEQYCLENIIEPHSPQTGGLRAAYCPTQHLPRTFDPSKIPVRKCCSINEIPHSETSHCELKDPYDADWRVPFENQSLFSSNSQNFTSIYEVSPGYPECKFDELGEFLGSNWEFYVRSSDGHVVIPPLRISSPFYCIDDFQSINRTDPYVYICLSEELHRSYIQRKPGCQKADDFCIDKCCDPGQSLDHFGNCIKSDSFSEAKIISLYNTNGKLTQTGAVDFVYGSPFCSGRGLFVTKEEERGELLANGSLRYISFDPNECDPHVIQIIPKGEYCYDTVSFDYLNGQAKKLVEGALICYPDSSEALNRQVVQVNYIYSIFLAISDIFILVSFIIYLTVPDQTKRGLNKNIKLGHSILGRILLSFLFSLFFAYLCLIISKTASDPINLASNIACIALGVTMYISFLATFFWLNILCFELWWKCARQESSSGRRWIWYQVYAWGNPLLLGTFVLYIEFSPLIGPCFVKPNFGIHSCFFSETRTFGSAAKWIYLNGPVAVLLTVDLIFFLLTVKSLLQTVQQSHKGTVRRQARQRLKLCFKLFLVMGICWLTEIISAAIEAKWYVTEVFNCLQGFIIFLIFILKPKILEAVKNRCSACCCGQPSKFPPPRGTITFTASSVLSDFFSSTKRHYPHSGAHNLSVSSFSTTSSTLSWGNGSLSLHSPSSSPASQKVSRRSPFLTIEEGPRDGEETDTSVPSIKVIACPTAQPPLDKMGT